MEVLLEFIKTLLEDNNPKNKLKEVAKLLGDIFKLMPSEKHMVGKNLGCLEPTASLRYRTVG